MAKAYCSICNRNFKNEEALEMHNKSKHAPSNTETILLNVKKIRNWTIGVVIIGFILALIGWAIMSAANSSASCLTMPATEMNIGGHTNLALHIHPFLTIFIDGVQQPIPANIGIFPGVMRPVHTHDATGELHIESKCVRTFRLGDFFDIWGKEFSKDQILNKTSAEGTITMTVNGQQSDDFENLPLRDGDRIVIRFDSF